MIRRALLSLALLLPVHATAQEEVEQGTGAILRGLDKVSGVTADFAVPQGVTMLYERMEVTVKECRFPAGNPSGDAYAFLEIREQGKADLAFQGWMIASSPALNALDNARYDIWVMRCKT